LVSRIARCSQSQYADPEVRRRVAFNPGAPPGSDHWVRAAAQANPNLPAAGVAAGGLLND